MPFKIILIIVGLLIFLSWMFCLHYPKYYKRVRNTWLTLVSVVFILGLVVIVLQARNMKERARRSAANSNLHYMYEACQTYWKDKGEDKVCDLSVATRKEYGFVPSKVVKISGKGTAKDFTATARHIHGDKDYSIDSRGYLSFRKWPEPDKKDNP